jgi:O-antigen/teichoic acid export membrane protein
MTDVITPVSPPTDERSSLSRRVSVDSLWIIAGYGVTSAAGFIFWIVAARLVEPTQLGFETAVFSAITAAAGIAASGVGNALLVFLPVSGSARQTVLRLGWRLGAMVSAVTGLVAGVLVVMILQPEGSPVLTVVLITAAAMLWSFFVLKDPVLTALGSARSTLLVNGPVNLAKLALIPVLVSLAGGIANPVVLSALIPAAAACVFVYAIVIPRLMRTTAVRDTAAVSDWAQTGRSTFLAFIVRDGTANALYLGLTLALPFIVTALVGSAEGAVFALCFQVSIVLDLVVIAVGSSLATHSAGDHPFGGRVALQVWLKVLAVVSVGAVALVLVSPIILGLLGNYYAASDGGMVITILAVASVFRTSYEIWTSSLRARRKTTAVLVCGAAYVVLLVPAVIILGTAFGVVGAATALLIVTIGLSVAGIVGIVRTSSTEATA